MNDPSASSSASAEPHDDNVVRLSVLEVLRELLKEGKNDAALDLVAKLVARNADLEKRLAQLNDKQKRGEGVSTAQLHLFLKALNLDADKAIADANKRLSDAAPLPPPKDDDPPRPPKPPRNDRRPPSPNLRRVENLIKVPDAERPCPICGTGRICIGHEVTEIIDLIPAEVIVRVDKREKLACVPCESEIVVAPLGDKVVAGGIYGSALVAN